MDIKSIIKEQRKELEDINKKEKIIPREGLQNAEKYLKHPNILAILGIRRCGKSIFSYLLSKQKNCGYVNFDDERLAGITSNNLNEILESFYELYGDIEYVVLDEIQNVKNWELFANRIRRTKKVILTGSNSKLLSSELSTHLTGRYIDIVLFPFSFTEFLNLKQFKTATTYTTREKADIINLLKEYLETGGFPEAHLFGKAIITKIYDDIITKDILLRYKIKKITDIKNLAKYLITNFCEETSYTRLSKIIGVKRVFTISNWTSYLENAFLIIKVERFSFKLKQQFIAPKKIYCIDTGIVNTIGFRFSENNGKFMENCVMIQLQRKKMQNNSIEIYYWKDYQQNEVDFILKQDKKITQLIQVTYANTKIDIREREIKSLIKCSKELKCENNTIITWDYETKTTIKGKKITFIPLWKWLSQQDIK